MQSDHNPNVFGCTRVSNYSQTVFLCKNRSPRTADYQHRSIFKKNASGISYETTDQVAGEGEAAGTASYSQATALTFEQKSTEIFDYPAAISDHESTLNLINQPSS